MRKRISLSSLEAFIGHDLREKLRVDLANVRIIREADIACCAYYHLRRFLHSDKTWRVFTERYSKITGHIIDVVIFRGGLDSLRKLPSPRIALELKWDWTRISKKDRLSLNKCIKLLGVRKVYFISLYKKMRDKEGITKTESEKFKLFEIFIHPEMEKGEFALWNTNRRLFSQALSEKKATR